MNLDKQTAFLSDLKALCKAYGVTELVGLADINREQTAVVQVSNTKFSNQYYNDFKEQLETELYSKLKTPDNGE